MNLKMGILVLTMAVGTAAAQNPNVIQNTRAKLNAVAGKQANDSNAALHGAPGQAAKPSAAAAVKPATAKPASAKTSESPAAAKTAPVKVAAKPAGPQVKATPMGKIAGTQKETAKKGSAPDDKGADKNPDAVGERKYAMTGKRDPFVSPVVAHAGGSGCSTGKKCLEIGQIALKGVVRADSGMIAVVTNTLNKAYFLRENDPVFNGYVVKITGDSIIFKETYQDRLGKSFTREVVKKITTPAV